MSEQSILNHPARYTDTKYIDSICHTVDANTNDPVQLHRRLCSALLAINYHTEHDNPSQIEFFKEQETFLRNKISTIKN